MTGESKRDAIVIGAGIIGSAIAFELAKHDFRVVCVDKLPASGYGPTSNSCAIVRSHYSSRDGVAMAYEAYFYWSDWEGYLGAVDELGAARFVDNGVVIVKSDTGHHKKAVAHYKEIGVSFEDWDPDEFAEQCPLYDVGSFFPPKRPSDVGFYDAAHRRLDGAIFTPQAGYVIDPQLATHNIQRAAEAAGAEFLFRREVVEIRRHEQRAAGIVLSDGEEIEAPIVINVAGPHSGYINRLAGVEDDMQIRTRPLRHEVHYVPAPVGSKFGATGITTSDGDLGIYFRPVGENHILVGSEDPPCDQLDWVDDPNEFDRGVTESQWQAQVFRLARRIPTLPIPNHRKGIVDLYDVSDDWIPIYDRSSLPGFYMAVGTSGNQFKTAPVAGHLMAELIQKVESGHDHDRDPVQVKCPYTGVVLDAGFYSRRRKVVSASSFSVMG